MNCKQLTELVIEPTLRHFDLYSESAVNLLLGTAAQESALGESLLSGCARGLYKIEPGTEKGLLEWLHHKKIKGEHWLVHAKVIEKIERNIIRDPKYSIDFLSTDLEYPLEDLMITDLVYATIMCRLYYYRVPELLPNHYDLKGLARFWKKYYNTEEGTSTEEEFIENYRRYVR